MGIYPRTTRSDAKRNPDGTETWTETWTDYAVERTRTVTAAPWVERRITCYCCTCGEAGSDPYCRNHGFAAERPCEEHGMPGLAGEEGEMPESVQAYNAKRQRRAEV